MFSKTSLSFAPVVTRTFSEFLACINLEFFCLGNIVSKTELYSALDVTGTTSEFLACVYVISFFAGVKASLKLHSPLRSSLQVPSPNFKPVLPSPSFFLLGKIVS